MRIQHNIMAMNAYRNYNTNTSALSKNLEKLSSGYKINRAGDDAAGLAISEKMRAQITGLNAAQKNVKDGISLVKTAEGAMQEIQDMLNRMDYLATQSANGTYDNDVDRANLQKEVNQLKSEINRIADSSNFNGIKLLDGSLDASIKSTNSANASDVTAADFEVVADGQQGQTGQAGVFSIDFTDASVTGKGTTAVKLNVFGKDLTIIAAGAAATDTTTLEGADLADAVVTQWNAQTDTNKTYGGVVMSAERQGNKVVFTMSGAPTAALGAATTGKYTGAANSSQGEEVTVTTEKDAISASSARKYGQAKITLDESFVKDGKTLKIGDTTYVFAVGANSKYKGAENVIDLTDFSQDAVADKITDGTVGRRLSTAAADNKNFKVGSENNGATITFTEREGGVDYSKNDLSGGDNFGEYLNGGAAVDTNNTKVAGAAHWKGLIEIGDVDTLASGKSLTLQIGDTSDSYNQLKVSVGDMHTSALGIADLDISNPESAAAAIQTIRDAINRVSSVRGDLGATQNRLEHTANNLSVMAENIQDAESTIRDTDVAEEMMAYTKNNILIQSAQAMLAQANAVPQGVLQLLG